MPIRNDASGPAAGTNTNRAGAATTPGAVTTTPAASAVWGAGAPAAGGPARADAFASGGNPVDAKNALMGAAVTAMAMAPVNGPSEFDMVPGRYPTTVPLPAVLDALGSTPEGREAIGNLFVMLKAKTGTAAPQALIDDVKSHPKKLMAALELSPRDMTVAIGQVDAAYKAGKIKAPDVAPNLLPQKFNFNDFDSIVSPPRTAQLKPLGGPLFTGPIPSSTSDAQIKSNRVMAETFDRLVKNASNTDPSKTFEVTYKGQAYTTLNDFTAALTRDGYQLEVNFETRIANFTQLKTLVPGSNPPQYLDVAAPVMVKTGYRDGQNKMAMVPAAHSEMNIAVKGGPNPKLNSDLRFFQGMGGTGFFPANQNADPVWAGRTSHGIYTGADAMKAIRYAGAFADIIHVTGKEQNLYAEGYGQTGVCDDSLAVIHQAIAPGKGFEYYPLLMQDTLMTRALKERLADADTSNDEAVRAIAKAIRELPSDVNSNDSAPKRAIAAMPWKREGYPFNSTTFAVDLLNER